MIGEQTAPEKASTNVLELFKLLPPPTLTSISTEVLLAGTVKEYHTSYVVPQLLVGEPTVAWYNVPAVVVQVVPGVKDVGPGPEQLLSFDGCASKTLEIKRNRKMLITVRVVAVDMV